MHFGEFNLRGKSTVYIMQFKIVVFENEINYLKYFTDFYSDKIGILIDFVNSLHFISG